MRAASHVLLRCQRIKHQRTNNRSALIQESSPLLLDTNSMSLHLRCLFLLCQQICARCVTKARLADEYGHLRKRVCSCTDNRLVTVVVHLALYVRMRVCMCIFCGSRTSSFDLDVDVAPTRIPSQAGQKPQGVRSSILGKAHPGAV